MRSWLLQGASCWVLGALAAVTGGAVGENGSAAGRSATEQSSVARPVSARILLEPASVEVGEPFRVTVVVEHPRRLGIRIGAEGAEETEKTGKTEIEPLLELDRTWVLFGEEGLATRPDPNRPGSSVTTQGVVLASLEPGERALPAIAIDYTQDDLSHRFLVEPAQVTVRGLLAPEEDAPRPLTDFRDVPEQALTPAAWLARGLLGAALVGLCVLAWRLLRRRRVVPPAPAPTPRAVFEAAVANAQAGGAEAVRELHYVITREVRRAAEERAPSAGELAGRTDDEWLAALAEHLEPALRERLAALFDDCASVKYGLAEPTAFAVRETVERARALLEALASAEAAARTEVPTAARIATGGRV